MKHVLTMVSNGRLLEGVKWIKRFPTRLNLFAVVIILFHRDGFIGFVVVSLVSSPAFERPVNAKSVSAVHAGQSPVVFPSNVTKCVDDRGIDDLNVYVIGVPVNAIDGTARSSGSTFFERTVSTFLTRSCAFNRYPKKNTNELINVANEEFCFFFQKAVLFGLTNIFRRKSVGFLPNKWTL